MKITLKQVPKKFYYFIEMKFPDNIEKSGNVYSNINKNEFEKYMNDYDINLLYYFFRHDLHKHTFESDGLLISILFYDDLTEDKLILINNINNI